MAAAPAPSPPSDDIAATLLDAVWEGVTRTVSQNPWLIAVVIAVLVPGLVRGARIAIHSGPKDPVRRFTRRDKHELLNRAGSQCEKHVPLLGRCRATDKLEADHVHPHSRGGWTHLSNGQILCKDHNRAKSAHIPWQRTLNRLAERHLAYYPAGVDTAIVRRRSTKDTEATTVSES